MSTPYEMSCCFCCSDGGLVNVAGTEWSCFTFCHNDFKEVDPQIITFSIQQCRNKITNGKVNHTSDVGEKKLGKEEEVSLF